MGEEHPCPPRTESSDSVSEDEDRKGPQPGEIFICVSESSLVPEKILRHGHDEDCVFSFLVRYAGFDHFYETGFLPRNYPLK